MSKPIIISHAYRGFIYLPLFLAKHSGFFPRNVELRYSNGDKHAVEELFAHRLVSCRAALQSVIPY